jgi:hypothetical protein
VVTPLLAGCGTGFQAQTNQIYQPGPGISVRDDGVYAINTLIVTDGNGNGTLVTALINQATRPDTLVRAGVSYTTTGRPLTTKILGGRVLLPPQQPVQLGYTGDVRVEGRLIPGTYVSLSLTFRNGAPVDLEIPIVKDSLDYAGVPIGPIPTTPRQSGR